MDLYRLAKQRDRDGNVLTGAISVMGRRSFEEDFEELMDEENKE